MANGDCNRLRVLVCLFPESVKCNYESCFNVVNKSKIKSEPPSVVTTPTWQYHSEIGYTNRTEWAVYMGL
jgi:hypothetical protein